MQDTIKINGVEIYPPDSGLKYAFETTYTQDSTRTQDGEGHFSPLFTVEQLEYSSKGIPVADAAIILQMVAKGQRFTLHYFSTYYGVWRDATFYVGKGACQIGTLEEGGEFLSSLSFNMTGVKPI